jgi:hypothetical protein
LVDVDPGEVRPGEVSLWTDRPTGATVTATLAASLALTLTLSLTLTVTVTVAVTTKVELFPCECVVGGTGC